MKTFMVVVGVLLLSSSVLAAPGRIESEGKCNLHEAGAFEKGKIVIVELRNRDVEVKFNLRGSEFFGRFVIQTTPSISNLSSEDKHVAYNIAFFDRSGGLIDCASSSADLEGGEKDLYAGSNMPEIPRDDLARIQSYKAVVYVTEGKKE